MDTQACHNLSAVHRGADGGNRQCHVDHRTGFQSLGSVLTDTDNAQLPLTVPLGDEAGNFGGA